MIVGNDVVDLDDPEARGAARRDRFVRRILRPAERRAVEASSDPDAALWARFAAKEAAYKAAVRLHGGAPSAPAAYEVAEDLAWVRLHALRLHLVVETPAPRASGRPAFVHAVAFSGDWDDRPRFAAGPHRGDPGADARSLLAESAAASLGCDPSRLRIVRDPIAGSWDGFGPPRLHLDGLPLPAPVSLSHHGRFVAYAHGAVAQRRRHV
ncbi:MAG TPA: 4'-phosphopantetheinyl transferase superfamily protein [Vulgatibacter sp.]|nr:4'-phosphopantetheinyl transferase superfamily protein [Vulgatibacter sp.]